MQIEFTYPEAMKLLEISRANFYTRLEKSKKVLDGHIVMKDGKKHITTEGIEILRNPNTNIEKPIDVPVQPSKEVARLEEQIKMMAEQLVFHQEQIREKDSQIKTLTTLHQNEQLLLRQSQDQCKFLTESVETIDAKENKSFWITNWFKKKS